MAEVWKTINEFNNKYAISSKGRVKNIDRDRLVKVWNDKDGYPVVTLRYCGKSHTRRIGRLIALAFIPNPFCKPQVNHIDENKKNSSISNLEWVTLSENQRHGTCQERKAAHLRKPVEQYDLNGNYIKTYPSEKAAELESGIFSTHIADVCKGKIHCNTAGGYIWKFKEVK